MKTAVLLSSGLLAVSLSCAPLPAAAQQADEPVGKPGAARRGDGAGTHSGVAPAPTPEPNTQRRAGEAGPAGARPETRNDQPPGNGAAQTSARPDQPARAQDRPKDTTGQANRSQDLRQGESEPRPAGEGGRASGAGQPRPAGAASRSDPGEAGKAAGENGTPERARAGEARPAGARAEDGRKQDRPRVQGRLDIGEKEAAGLRGRLAGRTDAVTTVRFDVAVGAKLPASVTFREVPAEIVGEYPQFRNYAYVITEDDIVIVDPRTREIVEVIGGGERRASRGTARRERRTITTEQRQAIHRSIQVDPAARVDFDERTVHEVPDTVVLKRLPPVVVREVPDIEDDEYFVDRNDRVILVDPDTREVVDVLE